MQGIGGTNPENSLQRGIDPGEHRKAKKLAKEGRLSNSFEIVAREWFKKYSINCSATHADRTIRRFERDIYPLDRGKPVSDITAPQLLNVVRRIEQRGALETGHRALVNCGRSSAMLLRLPRATRDPSIDLKGALPP